MANLKNINLMSQDTFESITPSDDELYAVSASGIGFPSSRYEDLTLGASGTQYTAPANGWFYLDKYAGGTQSAIFINKTKNFKTVIHALGNGYYTAGLLPVQTGDVVQIDWSLSGTITAFRFIYAEGE